MKKKTKLLIIAAIVAVISLTVLCGTWAHGCAAVHVIFSVTFFLGTLVAGCIACTYEEGHDDDF